MKIVSEQSIQMTCHERTDLSLAARCTILSGDLEETVGVNFEGSDKFGLTAGHWWNAVQLELAEETVVAALCALTLIAMHIVS